MRCSRAARALVAGVVAGGVLAGGLPHASDAAACAAAWTKPVDGAVVDPFRAPPNPYGPGNRGIDLAAPPGTPVRAAGSGVVAFAGQVGGTLHVVVEHTGGLRTTYAFLSDVGVRAGQSVGRGQVVGSTGGGGPGQPAGSVHFGLRLGDRYVDPTVLFGPCDLTKLVHLAPVDQPDRRPWDALRTAGVATTKVVSGGGGGLLDDLAGALGTAASVATDTAGLAWDAATDVGSPVVEWAARFGAETARQLYRRSPTGNALSLLGDVGLRVGEWWAQRDDCADDAPPADGTGGSTHLLLAVGGIDSRGGGSEPTFGLDTQALGYDEGDVTFFSYAPDGGRYGPDDTRRGIDTAARRLAAQLRRSQRDHPGRQVDLIAHSQGGVVVDAFLQHVYRSGDSSYPPIGTVVTLASPHQGAPLASSAGRWRESVVGGAVLDGAGAAIPLPPADAPSVRDLDEGSGFVRGLWRTPLPDHIRFTTIGGTDDVVVPATQIGVPGATEVVVNVGGGPLDDHTNIPSDPGALRAVRAALEGRPPPCTDAGDGLRGAVAPVVISRVERGLGLIPAVLP
jgi:hypothetical protein